MSGIILNISLSLSSVMDWPRLFYPMLFLSFQHLSSQPLHLLRVAKRELSKADFLGSN